MNEDLILCLFFFAICLSKIIWLISEAFYYEIDVLLDICLLRDEFCFINYWINVITYKHANK